MSSYGSLSGEWIPSRYMRHWDEENEFLGPNNHYLLLDTPVCNHSLPIEDLDSMLEINMSGTKKRRRL